MRYQGIDWVALGEAVVFVVACGVVGLVVAFLATLWYVACTRRAMMRRYTQERDARLAERVDFGATEVKSKTPPPPPPPPAPPPSRTMPW